MYMLDCKRGISAALGTTRATVATIFVVTERKVKPLRNHTTLWHLAGYRIVVDELFYNLVVVSTIDNDCTHIICWAIVGIPTAIQYSLAGLTTHRSPITAL